MMLSETIRRERSDQKEQNVGTPRNGPLTNAHDTEHVVHSLQRTLGNQAVLELHRRGELHTNGTASHSAERPPSEAEQAVETVSDTRETSPTAPSGTEGSTGGGVVATETVAEVTSETEDEPTSEGTEEAEEPETRTAAPTTDTVAGDTTPESPEEDPAFQAVVEQIESVAARKRAHPSAEAASAEAQAAAESPANEVPSKGAANQVAEMAQQQPQLFDRAVFKETLSQRIGEITPETLEEADEFKDSSELVSVKSELVGTVEQEKARSQGPIEETTNEAPDTSTVEPKPVRPLEPPDVGSPPSGIGAERAAPKPKTEFEVSTPFQERSQTLDQQLAEEGITEEQLEDANESEFSAALQAKDEAQTHAAHAPTEYRQHEQSVLSGARAETETLAQTELQTMHDDRSQRLDQVSELQERAKQEDERKREEIASDIQQIYDETKQSVNDRLTQLEQEVYRTFDQGAEEARALFENYVADRMRAYKAERYSGPRGWGRWVRDRFRPLPPEVSEFYVEGRKAYLRAMDSVIDRVADVVETGLVETTERIAEGRRKISEYVENLPESLKAVGQEAASNIQSEFNELEQTVENKKGELIDSLAHKYNEKIQQIDARIEELKAENRGLFERALGAVAGVIRTITQLKDMLLSVLGKATSAAESIIRDPIGFLGNLVTGIKQGLGNFLSNIWTHLQAGLINWLMGALTEAGIRLPEQFDLAGIFSLVMQVLGLTYENIRARAVKVLGEETVSALEKAFEIFQVLVTEGVAGLWAYVEKKIGDLEAMVMDKIRELIATQVIEAGIKWIMGLLGPVGAFIKACTAIYDVVTFFLRRASEVASLVDAVMDSILAIAKGDVSGAAKLVEDALVRSIPTVIGFLANLLGLGDLPKKIQGVIKAVQEPIGRAIEWVLEQAKAAVRKLGTALGIGKKEETKTGPDERSRGDKERDLNAAVNEADELLRNSRKSIEDVEETLPKIKATYRLTRFELITKPAGETTMTVWVEGVINPDKEGDKHTVSKDDENEIIYSAPADRHRLHKIKQNTVAKDKNTVIEGSVDVGADVEAINRGEAKELPNRQFEINSRIYGSHDNGRLYPIAGEGFHQLNRDAFKALGVYNKFGETPRAEEILDQMTDRKGQKGISEEDRDAALKVFRSSG